MPEMPGGPKCLSINHSELAFSKGFVGRAEETSTVYPLPELHGTELLTCAYLDRVSREHGSKDKLGVSEMIGMRREQIPFIEAKEVLVLANG